MIKLEKVNKYYVTDKRQFHALKNVNLEVNAGEIFGIIGHSGAGKSTLLRCVNALERPDSGRVLIDDIDILSLPIERLRSVRRNIGMIFQHFNLLSSRTVYQNIAFPLEIVGLKKTDIQNKVFEMAQLTGLEEKLMCYPSQLSGGQKQRVAIARALISGVKILLCDEATSSLDPKTTQSILELLLTIRQTLHVTILLITHEMHVIKTICDRVAVLDQGCIIEEGETAHIFANPQTHTAEQFAHSSLNVELPRHLQAQLKQVVTARSISVLRLWFLKESAKEAVIAHLVKRFYVDVTILQASLEYIHHHPMGIMLITIEAHGDKLDHCVDYLNTQNIKVELLGYFDVGGEAC